MRSPREERADVGFTVVGVLDNGTLAPVGRTAPTQSAEPRSAPTEPDRLTLFHAHFSEDGAHGGQAVVWGRCAQTGQRFPLKGAQPLFIILPPAMPERSTAGAEARRIARSFAFILQNWGI